ncbi:Thioredoxin F-type [Phytophthora nicotianae]|nr:Thioredoxin F-type [Phytophthora nicotianae]
MLEMAAPQEEKLSTKAIRKRLGLVDRSGTQASASETVAREEQESIQSEMMSLAKQLKDRTQTINQSLAEDVKILDAVGQSAESNTALLDRENAKLKEQLASSIGLWTSLWLVAMLVIVFVVTYFYMKLFSRRW